MDECFTRHVSSPGSCQNVTRQPFLEHEHGMFGKKAVRRTALPTALQRRVAGSCPEPATIILQSPTMSNDGDLARLGGA